MMWTYPRIIASAIVGLAICSFTPNFLSADDDFARGKPESASMPVTPSGEWSLERLLSMNRAELFEIWKKLPAAPMREMNGHYQGLVPNFGKPTEQARTSNSLYNENSRIGYWLGKAYKAHSDTKGEGYNRFRLPNGKVVRNRRFGTEMGKSLIDGKPALLMYYGHFDDSDLVDEIRKLDDYVYVGVGTRPTEDGTRSDAVRGTFVLLGPTDEWVGPQEK